MKKLPYGISNYEKLINQDCYYIDKTMYIEKMENPETSYIMFLRPRKFGKTLFTSTLEYYYDKNKADLFEKLFKGTYIYEHQTPMKNSYDILKFNFSGIDTSDVESTISGFKNKVIASINVFINEYNIDFYIDKNQSAEDILNDLFKAFKLQKSNEKIYVIIDEYDHFANELLSFHTDKFKELVTKNGKVRKWYEILKEGTESVVDRIFITGVSPITLDSLTSGFNICSDKTRDSNFNEMLGFTKNELIKLMKLQEFSESEIEKLLPILKENYDGYKFSIEDNLEEMYNSNMCLYFINSYVSHNKKIPNEMMDMNIASDYSKLAKMLDLSHNENKLDILEKTLTDDGILSNIIEKFNPEVEFGEQEFVSMLFYLGYLTIKGEQFGISNLKVPNKIMKELYADYFIKIIGEGIYIDVNKQYVEITQQIATDGKIDLLIKLVEKYLNNLSNRDFQRFDEKYVKIIFYCILMNLKIFNVKSEPEFNRNYPDLLVVPYNKTKGYKGIMLELKYLKKGEEAKLEEKRKEAIEQIKRYNELDEVKKVDDIIRKYAVVAVVDKIYVDEVE